MQNIIHIIQSFYTKSSPVNFYHISIDFLNFGSETAMIKKDIKTTFLDFYKNLHCSFS